MAQSKLKWNARGLLHLHRILKLGLWEATTNRTLRTSTQKKIFHPKRIAKTQTIRISTYLLSHHICTNGQFPNMALIRFQLAINVLIQIKLDSKLM